MHLGGHKVKMANETKSHAIISLQLKTEVKSFTEESTTCSDGHTEVKGQPDDTSVDLKPKIKRRRRRPRFYDSSRKMERRIQRYGYKPEIAEYRCKKRINRKAQQKIGEVNQHRLERTKKCEPEENISQSANVEREQNISQSTNVEQGAKARRQRRKKTQPIEREGELPRDRKGFELGGDAISFAAERTCVTDGEEMSHGAIARKVDVPFLDGRVDVAQVQPSVSCLLRESPVVELVQQKVCANTKANGRSTRYQNETEEKRALRRAYYAEKSRRFKERETLEQRELRLARERRNYHLKYAARRKQRKKELATRKALQTIGAVEKPAPPPYSQEPQTLVELKEEYANFKQYIQEKCSEARQIENQRKVGHETKRSNPFLPIDVHTGVNLMSGYNFVASTQRVPTIYSNDPIDPEIALLQTSDEKFVAVQVINQSVEDFDDMFEIENVY